MPWIYVDIFYIIFYINILFIYLADYLSIEICGINN